MHIESMMAAKPIGSAATIVRRLATCAATAAFLMAPGAVLAVEKAVTFETIPGSALKRVMLTAKAAERLGIETGAVSEKAIVRTQMFGGQVSHPLRVEMVQKNTSNFAGFTAIAARPAATPAAAAPVVPAPGEAWIALAVSPEEWDRIAQDRPARLLPLATREKMKGELMAEVSKLPPVEDPKREMLTVYYVVKSPDHGLAANTRLRVELPLKGSNEKRTVVPYSALYYDNKGLPWVYLNPKPLTYERQRVEVERIVGDDAILTEGPKVGTQVVTTGASFLYGAEVVFKK
jgi:hypothetical protein